MSKKTARKTWLIASLVLILGFALGEFFPLSFIKGMRLGATEHEIFTLPGFGTQVNTITGVVEVSNNLGQKVTLASGQTTSVFQPIAPPSQTMESGMTFTTLNDKAPGTRAPKPPTP